MGNLHIDDLHIEEIEIDRSKSYIFVIKVDSIEKEQEAQYLLKTAKIIKEKLGVEDAIYVPSRNGICNLKVEEINSDKFRRIKEILEEKEN